MIVFVLGPNSSKRERAFMLGVTTRVVNMGYAAVCSTQGTDMQELVDMNNMREECGDAAARFNDVWLRSCDVLFLLPEYRDDQMLVKQACDIGTPIVHSFRELEANHPLTLNTSGALNIRSAQAVSHSCCDAPGAPY